MHSTLQRALQDGRRAEGRAESPLWLSTARLQAMLHLPALHRKHCKMSDEQKGVLIRSVQPISFAHGHLLPGDVLMAFDGVEVACGESLIIIPSACAPPPILPNPESTSNHEFLRASCAWQAACNRACRGRAPSGAGRAAPLPSRHRILPRSLHHTCPHLPCPALPSPPRRRHRALPVRRAHRLLLPDQPKVHWRDGDPGRPV